MKASNYNTMKTKAEILESYFGSDFYLLKEHGFLGHVLKAMDEYARAALEKAARVGGVRQTTKYGSYSASLITDPEGNTYEVDKSSITDIELP